MRTKATLILPLLVAACAETGPVTPDASNRFDHVMVGIADLDSGVVQLEAMTGVTAVYGGIHPGRDTRNALLSLGDGSYFELIAPQADLETITDPIAEATLGMRTPTPMHWAVATDNMEATKAVVEGQGWGTTEIIPRSRETPDGTVLEWRMFFITEDADAAYIPFFIEWSSSTVHPSITSPDGCALTDFVVHTPDIERISSLITALDIDVDASSSAEDRLEVVMNCAGTEVSM